MHKKPTRVEYRKIDTMVSTTSKKIEIFEVKLQSVSEHFSIEIEIGRMDRGGVINNL